MKCEEIKYASAVFEIARIITLSLIGTAFSRRVENFDRIQAKRCSLIPVFNDDISLLFPDKYL